MPLTLTIHNRQRARGLETRRLRQLVHCLLGELLGVLEADLGLILVSSPEMTRANEQFLGHEGSTDVITFDHSPGDRDLDLAVASRPKRPQAKLRDLHGELFVCIDEALIQGRRFHTTWQTELVRYVIHGVLHLRGFDDQHAGARRVMKREENRLLRKLARRFDFQQLARPRQNRAA